MAALVRRYSFLVFLLLTAMDLAPAYGADWTQPTAQELKMTSDPAAPGAEAVYLLYEERADDQAETRTVYARIKILTRAGAQDYGDVVIPYERDTFYEEGIKENVNHIEGRTIHSDGTVIPFRGKPWTKEVVKAGGMRILEKGFSLPDVEVGSIVEYRYTLHYEGNWPPHWYIKKRIPVEHAHYNFVSNPYSDGGYWVEAKWEDSLPKNAKVKVSDMKGWDLEVNNVPPLVQEKDAPPERAVGAHVYFYYALADSADLYWQLEGQGWGKAVDKYCAPGKLKAAARQITAGATTDREKLKRIYAAVMKLENTSFTRERTKQENKAEGVKAKTAADVWAAQRGDSDEIALLFIAMARAAGLQAEAMMVTDRDRDVFLKERMDWDQLDDVIAIANVDGKEMYFDPGERYCEFGKLAWMHTWTTGIRQVGKNGAELAETPFPQYANSVEVRQGALTLGRDGSVGGKLEVMMTGNVALHWRQEALLTDAEHAQKEFEEKVQKAVAPGVTVTMEGFAGLTDPEKALVATLTVSGRMGTEAGSRTILPGSFFEAQEKPMFVETKRVNPVYLPYSYTVQDRVTMTLPAGERVEVLPKSARIGFAPNADYAVKYVSTGNTYTYLREVRVAQILYTLKEYPALRSFFERVTTQDQAQVVLQKGGQGQ